MPGLCGYFSIHPNKRLHIPFDEMIEQNLRGEYRSVSGDSFKIVNLGQTQNENKELRIDDGNRLQVITCGEVYNKNIINLDESILDLYKQNKLHLLKNFNGPFVGVIYDETRRKAVLVNDRYGTLKTYYHINGETCYFAPKIKLLLRLGAPKSLRMESVYDFFLFGYVLGDNTLFNNIFQLPPASILEVTDQGFKFMKYWDFKSNGADDPRPFSELTDELHSLWQQAVERRIAEKDKPLIFLSGGLDSRAVLGASLRCVDKAQLHTVTYGQKGSFDYELGRLVAEDSQLINHSLEMDHIDHRKLYLISLYDSEGMIDATPHSPTEAYKKLKEYGDIIISGYMGGELMGPLIFPKLTGIDPGTKDGFMRARLIVLDHHRLNKVEEVQNIFAAYAHDKNHILSSFEETLTGLHNISREKLPNYCAAWLYRHENDKYTSFCNFRFKETFKYAAPFLDNDLVDFMLRTPPELRIDKKLYKSMLVKYYPELFSLPVKSTHGLELNANHLLLLTARFHARLKRSINKASTMTIRRNVLTNKSTNYIDYANYVRMNGEYQRFLHDHINALKKRHFLNNDHVDTLWDRHMHGKENKINLLCLLGTFELFLEEFVDC